MEGFVYRRQQIGQLELLAALVPYLSRPDIFGGARVIHWVDNSSAVAALAAGYSGVPDSARLVHAFHATAAGLGTAVWFEYVRTKANVADEPSRVNLGEGIWDCGLDDCGAGLRSWPTEVRLPEARDWAEPAAEWALGAKRRRRWRPA